MRHNKYFSCISSILNIKFALYKEKACIYSNKDTMETKETKKKERWGEESFGIL